MDLVPHDVVVAILQRLAPRSLAVSRCVCKEWRCIVDARCHLPKDLLPVSLGGIFVGLGHEPAPPVFFARPALLDEDRSKARGLRGDAEPDRFPHDLRLLQRAAPARRPRRQPGDTAVG
nr:unnamed protein product [Digitaria exilis]